MATVIKTKNGSGAPLASDLVQGELAIDLTNKRLYTENASGTVIELGTVPSTIDINAGTIDGTVIGGSTAAAGSFTSLTATSANVNGTVTADGLTVDGNVGIGVLNPAGLIEAAIDGTTDIIFGQAGGGDSTNLYLGKGFDSTSQIAFFRGNTATIDASIGVNSGETLEINYATAVAGNILTINNNSGEVARFDSSGALGIGTTTPQELLHCAGNIRFGDTAPAEIYTNSSELRIGVDRNDDNGASDITFYSNNSEKARIDASGVLLVGKTSASSATDGAELKDGDGSSAIIGTSNQTNASTGNVMILNRRTTDGEIVSFRKDGTTVGSIGVALGDRFYFMGAGEGIAIDNSGNTLVPVATDGTFSDATMSLGQPAARYTDLYLSGGLRGDTLTFSTLAGSERARINSSGVLLVGTTSTGMHTTSTETGVEIGDRYLHIARNSNPPAIFNRTTSDGGIAQFRKDGSTVGSIGTQSGYLTIGQSGATDAFLSFTGVTIPSIRPASSTGVNSDDTTDLGASSARFQDIYATNGTIQTSDANEKQDIDVLSEAEQRVALAAKKLLRKFRWKDAVAEKGDDARIHFGIIAQDLQAAFEAEGLDAGDYAMFIHTTWTDEETGEERSRMGVRYSELLAFIIAAI